MKPPQEGCLRTSITSGAYLVPGLLASATERSTQEISSRVWPPSTSRAVLGRCVDPILRSVRSQPRSASVRPGLAVPLTVFCLCSLQPRAHLTSLESLDKVVIVWRGKWQPVGGGRRLATGSESRARAWRSRAIKGTWRLTLSKTKVQPTMLLKTKGDSSDPRMLLKVEGLASDSQDLYEGKRFMAVHPSL